MKWMYVELKMCRLNLDGVELRNFEYTKATDGVTRVQTCSMTEMWRPQTSQKCKVAVWLE